MLRWKSSAEVSAPDALSDCSMERSLSRKGSQAVAANWNGARKHTGPRADPAVYDDRNADREEGRFATGFF